MQRVEAIKLKRQAHYIHERQRKAKEIEKQKDIKEVQRDLALIRSPAAGMKRPSKLMEVDQEEEAELEEQEELDTSISIGNKAVAKVLAKRKNKARIVEEMPEENDREMMEAN